MTTHNEKIAMWTALGVGVVLLIWLLLTRRAQTAQTTSPGVNYLSYNFPGADPWTGAATGGPQINASGDCGDCGCSGGASGGFFTSLQQMLNSFQQGATDAVNSYQDAVLGSYPDYVTQYFNNPAAAAQSAAFTQAVGGQMIGV